MVTALYYYFFILCVHIYCYVEDQKQYNYLPSTGVEISELDLVAYIVDWLVKVNRKWLMKKKRKLKGKVNLFIFNILYIYA